MFLSWLTKDENKGATSDEEDAPMAQIADILTRSRETLIFDALGVMALAGFTLGLLHLPGLL